MSRKGWVYLSDGRVLEKGSAEHFEHLAGQQPGPLVFSDEGQFVSPIDRKVYSGKAGMREHNARHDVVNNRDLAGLPTGVSGKVAPPTTRQREELRRNIVEAARSKGYFDGQ